MSTLQVSLLGKLCIRRDGKELTGFDALKVQELFCYLLLNRPQAQARETLASILWSDTTTAQSKKYLRKVLWQLQTLVDPQGKCSPQCTLLVDADWIEVNPQADILLDLDFLQDTFSELQGIRGQDLTIAQAESLRSAAELYKGDLLESWYNDWCIHERERYQFMYLALLDKLVDHCETHDLYEEGVLYAARILQFEPARERTHRRLMRLHYRAGDRTAALRQYQRCVETLRTELNVAPSRRTRRLHTQLQNDQLHLEPFSANLPPKERSINLEQPALVLNDLAALQADLLDALHHVQEAMQRIRQTPGTEI